jgi:hypothetical protein
MNRSINMAHAIVTKIAAAAGASTNGVVDGAQAGKCASRKNATLMGDLLASSRACGGEGFPSSCPRRRRPRCGRVRSVRWR